MKWLLQFLVKYVDDYSIKKKFFTLYIICVLFPLVLTDSVVINNVLGTEKDAIEHKMKNIANSVQFSFHNSINRASEIARSVYINKYIDKFLNKEYENNLDYFNNYQDFYKNTLLGNIVGIDNTTITMYSDNDSIVNGSEFKRIDKAYNYSWYSYLQNSGLDQILYFDYDTITMPAMNPKRRILFIQKLNYYNYKVREKVLKLELDCSMITRNITKMNYGTTVYICSRDLILISNGKYGSIGKNFVQFTEQVGYSQEISFYGMDFKIIVMKPLFVLRKELIKNLPIILLLVIINTILPYILVSMFNKSFTERIGKVSEAFKKAENDTLVKISEVQGKDEIGSLMRNYNLMVTRTNSLIQIVYKNKIHEQEITVARQSAELLALHSQINPHFLFNALESIRMHSIIKKEIETADMVEKLSIMQRQYMEWDNNLIDISKEMDFVHAYLGLQKYRFGDRLSFKLQIEEECYKLRIPKLSIVTFVENACVHGIESKLKPGWIFVRVFQNSDMLCLEIEDTGTGMSVSAMKELEIKMKKANIEMLKVKCRIGIVNACLRLNMISNNEVEYELDGEEGSGIIVQIRIPVQYVN